MKRGLRGATPSGFYLARAESSDGNITVRVEVSLDQNHPAEPDPYVTIWLDRRRLHYAHMDFATGEHEEIVPSHADCIENIRASDLEAMLSVLSDAVATARLYRVIPVAEDAA